MDLLKKKIQLLNIIALAIYIAGSLSFYFIDNLYYGIGQIIGFFMILSFVYFILAITFLIKNKEQGRLITIACCLNLVPLLLTVIFFLAQRFVALDSYGDHAILALFGAELLIAIVAVVVSFILFLIGYFKYKKSNTNSKKYVTV